MRIPVVLSIALVFGACGPSYGGQDVKTPDENVDEQERLEAEAEKTAKPTDESAPIEETDTEKKHKFDHKQAEAELKRATRSAETCPGVVTEAGPKGKPKVTLVFTSEGHVKSSSIEAPFDGTPLGKCVLQAMGAVVVPPYTGDAETIEWEIDLTGDKAAEEKPKK